MPATVKVDLPVVVGPDAPGLLRKLDDDSRHAKLPRPHRRVSSSRRLVMLVFMAIVAVNFWANHIGSAIERESVGIGSLLVWTLTLMIALRRDFLAPESPP